MGNNATHRSKNHVCFEECGCNCNSYDQTFDTIAAQELALPLCIRELCRQNIGWYCDKQVTSDHQLNEWNLEGRSGLYILWHKEEYCDLHDRFHMRAKYVGKGNLLSRIKNHWREKPTGELLLIYFTFVEMPNRLAKYAEQLILDCYNLPMNHSENPGTRILCTHFEQGQVD